jgi:predicted nucleic acid-binding protein
LAVTDVTIAAVALERDLPLITGNRKHYPMPELQLFALPEEA